MTSKQFHIAQLIAICVKKDLTPKKIGFSDYIYRLCATYWVYERRTARKYVDILIQAFTFDKWKGLVKANTFLKEEEREAWIQKHS